MSTNWYGGRALKALKKAISPPNRIKFSTVVLSVLFATSTTYAITQAEVEAIGNAKGTIVDGGLNANTDRELIYNAGIINAYYLKNLAREPDNPAINGSAVLWIEGDTGIYRVENSVFQGNRSGPHLNHGKSGVISKRGASTLEIKDSIFFGNFGGNNRDLEVSGLGHGSAVLDNYNADSISAIEGSNFANNTAGNGAVVHSYGTLYIKDSIFSNNSGQHAYLWNTGTAGVMNILSTGGAVVGDTRTGMILEDSAREFGLRNENILNLNATAGNKIVLTNSTLNNVATVNINPNTTDSNTAKMYNMATSSVEEITTRTTGTVDFDSIVKNDGDIKTFAGVINFNGHVNGTGTIENIAGKINFGGTGSTISNIVVSRANGEMSMSATGTGVVFDNSVISENTITNTGTVKFNNAVLGNNIANTGTIATGAAANVLLSGNITGAGNITNAGTITLNSATGTVSNAIENTGRLAIPNNANITFSNVVNGSGNIDVGTTGTATFLAAGSSVGSVIGDGTAISKVGTTGDVNLGAVSVTNFKVDKDNQANLILESLSSANFTHESGSLTINSGGLNSTTSTLGSATGAKDVSLTFANLATTENINFGDLTLLNDITLKTKVNANLMTGSRNITELEAGNVTNAGNSKINLNLTRDDFNIVLGDEKITELNFVESNQALAQTLVYGGNEKVVANDYTLLYDVTGKAENNNFVMTFLKLDTENVADFKNLSGAVSSKAENIFLTNDITAGNFTATINVANTQTVFIAGTGDGKSIDGGAIAVGFDVNAGTTAMIENFTLSNFGNAIFNEGNLSLKGVDFANNVTSLENNGQLTLLASTKDINFNGTGVGLNNTGTVDLNTQLDGKIVFEQSIANATGGVLNVNSSNIAFNGTVSGQGTFNLNIGEGKTIDFNSDMSGIAGTVNFNSGKIALKNAGTLFGTGVSLNVNGNTEIDFGNKIATHNLGAVNLNTNTLTVRGISADLNALSMSEIVGTNATTGTGTILVPGINLQNSLATDSSNIDFVHSSLVNLIVYDGNTRLQNEAGEWYKVSRSLVDANGAVEFTAVKVVDVSDFGGLIDSITKGETDLNVTVDIDVNGGISIDDDIKITGADGTPQKELNANQFGGDVGFVVNAPSGELTLENLTIADFNNTTTGAGAIVNNNILSVVDSSFTNNSSGNGGGGAIHNSSGATANVVAGSKDVEFTGNSPYAIYNETNGVVNLNTSSETTMTFNDAIFQEDGGILNINSQNNKFNGTTDGKVVFNADMTQVSGAVNFGGGTIEVAKNGTLFNDNTNFVVNANPTTPQLLKLSNTSSSQNHNLGNLTLNNDLLLSVAVDLEHKEMTNIKANSINANGYKLQVDEIRVLADSPSDGTVTIGGFASENLREHVEYIGASNIAGFSAEYTYDVLYEPIASSFSFTRVGANPALYSVGIANQTSFLTQIANYTESFRGLGDAFSDIKDERYASISDDLAMQSLANRDRSGIWVRPYYSKGNVKLDNHPTIKNEMFGALVGVDSDTIELDNGVEIGFGGYAGYNGATQRYSLNGQSSDVKIKQEGATVGALVSFGYGQMFGGVTLNAGLIQNKVSTSQSVDGDGKFNSYLGGIALKGGYNFRPYEDFIIQPSLMVAYSYIKSKDYKSSGGATVSSKGVNMFQVAPAVKLIKVFDDKLKGYIDVVGYVNGQSKVDAVTGAGNLLPDAKQKPYVKYNLGAEKAWGDGRFSGYVEAGVHSGSRDGYNVGFGFKYKLGKKTRSLNSVNYKNGSVDSYSF